MESKEYQKKKIELIMESRLTKIMSRCALINDSYDINRFIKYFEQLVQDDFKETRKEIEDKIEKILNQLIKEQAEMVELREIEVIGKLECAIANVKEILKIVKGGRQCGKQ